MDHPSMQAQMIDIRERLAQMQTDSFERGFAYGIQVAMQAMGATELTIDQRVFQKSYQRQLKVSELPPRQGPGAKYEIV